MLFNAIRLSLALVVFTLLQLYNRRKKDPDPVRKKRQMRCALFVAIALGVILYVVPIENIFVTFSSPESAYHYTRSEPVKIVVTGSTTDLVVAGGTDNNTFLILPKAQAGWKISLGYNDRWVLNTFCGETSVSVLRYKNTNEYYIMLKEKSGASLRIYDSLGSEFIPCQEYDRIFQQEVYSYFVHIGITDLPYIIWIDGEKYILPLTCD